MRTASDLFARPADPFQFENTLKVMRSAVADGVAPSMVAGVWDFSDPDGFLYFTAGDAKLETVFDLASVTKVFSTATLLSVAVDRGLVSFETPLEVLLPEWKHSKGVTLEMLASHTAGLPAWAPFYEGLIQKFSTDSKGADLWKTPVALRRQALFDAVTAVPLESRPKEKALYSDISFLLLGYALERAFNLPLDQAVERNVWTPFGIENAFYVKTDRSVESAQDPRVAPTENCAWRGGVIQGQVHDDNTWAGGGIAGHAGAFAPLRDVMQFASRWFQSGVSHQVRERSWRPVFGTERTPGWDTPSGESPSLGRYFSRRSVGHLGYTGTSLWLDLEKSIAVCLLTNRVHPTRENVKIKAFRPLFHDALAQDLFPKFYR